MARKGWDALSEPYRRRLAKAGVSRGEYESGVPLHKARGHVSAPNEGFFRSIRSFVHAYDTSDEPESEIANIKALGPERGREYMAYRRKMTRLYEGGDYLDAEDMYRRRDRSISNLVHYKTRDDRIVDGTWWYHGIFGG